ncbi:MAG: hypothetical protein U0984_08055 [Prosthecobacter sp.]|nr:hypothetical protein [Prosthecobacter sp.]
MKTKSLCLELGRAAALLSALVLCPGISLAQQQPPPGYGYPPGYQPAPAYPQYPQGPTYAEPPPRYDSELVSPHEFLPIFGRRFGEMFRRIFYGDDAPHNSNGSVPGGRSLDMEPPSYGSHYGPSTGLNIPPPYDQGYPPRYNAAPPPGNAPRYDNAPRYETPPPQQRQLTPAMPPGTRYAPAAPPPSSSSKRAATEKKSTQSTPPKKYTPPTITRTEPSQPKVETQPPAPAPEKTAAPNADYNFYPLPGNKPSTEKTSPPSKVTSNASKPAAGTGTGNSGSFLKGKRTGKAGRVTSPYPPYQELDVTGLSSGSLALDPTTQKVFEVP